MSFFEQLSKRIQRGIDEFLTSFRTQNYKNTLLNEILETERFFTTDVILNETGVSFTAPSSQKTLFSYQGQGEIIDCLIHVSHESVYLAIFIDGKNVWGGNEIIGFPVGFLNTWGFSASTPYISLLKYNASGQCDLLLSFPLKFNFLLEVKCYWAGFVLPQSAWGVLRIKKPKVAKDFSELP